jgi:hypothetical protein
MARSCPFLRRAGLACAAGFLAALWIGLLSLKSLTNRWK